MSFAGNYYAVLRGYIDVAFLLPMSAVFYLFVDYDFEKMNWVKNTVISLLLIMIWICRRYAIYFIIGFVVAMMVRAIFTLLQDKSMKKLKSVVMNFLQIGILSLGILLLFFRKFLFRALLTNYGAMYSAYDAPLSEKLSGLALSFGYVTAGILIVSGVLCFITRKQIVNYISFIAMILTEVFAFWQTQNMGVQHRMILNLPIFLICMLIFEQFTIKRDKTSRAVKGKGLWKNVIVAVLSLAMVFNFVKAFSRDFSTDYCGRFFSERYYPLRRDDIEQVKLLAEKLNELTEGGGDTVYVIASGNVLNCDMLNKLYMPETQIAIPAMVNTSDVDLRDGFPTGFLESKYVVTTSPIQTHLATGQEVITYLANLVSDPASYLGEHFKCIYEIELGEGVIAKVFEKVESFNENDLQNLRDYYTTLYPGYESIFSERIKE